MCSIRSELEDGVLLHTTIKCLVIGVVLALAAPSSIAGCPDPIGTTEPPLKGLACQGFGLPSVPPAPAPLSRKLTPGNPGAVSPLSRTLGSGRPVYGIPASDWTGSARVATARATMSSAPLVSVRPGVVADESWHYDGENEEWYRDDENLK